MIKQVICATGYPEFENKIIEYVNGQQDKDQYVIAHSATHIDNIVDRCASIRPSVLVIREDKNDVKTDFLEVIRQLVTRISNLHIVVITYDRQVGDPLITGLIMYNVYDFIISNELSPADVGNLILRPRSIQDIGAYLPKVNLKNNGQQLAFSAGDGGANASLTDIREDEVSDIADISSDIQSVAHVNQLDEVDDGIDNNSLYKQKGKTETDKTPSVLNVGSKLSYNPLFKAASKAEESPSFSMPKLHFSPRMNSISVKQKTVEQKQTISSEKKVEPAPLPSTVSEEKDSLTKKVASSIEEEIFVEEDIENIAKKAPLVEENVVAKELPPKKEDVPVKESTVQAKKVEASEKKHPSPTQSSVTEEQHAVARKEAPQKQDGSDSPTKFHNMFSWYNDLDLGKQVVTLKFVVSNLNPVELSTPKEMDEYAKIYGLYKDALAEQLRRKDSKKGGKD